MRIIFENNHVPAIGKYKDAVVEDAANGRRYLYDSCGTHLIFPTADFNAKFDFTTEDMIEIEHGQGKYPSVTVVDDDGDVVLANINYPDENNVTVTLESPMTGFVTLN